MKVVDIPCFVELCIIWIVENDDILFREFLTRNQVLHILGFHIQLMICLPRIDIGIAPVSNGNNLGVITKGLGHDWALPLALIVLIHVQGDDVSSR